MQRTINLFFIICLGHMVGFCQVNYSTTGIDESLLENANAVIRTESTSIEMIDYSNLKVKTHKVVTLLNKNTSEDELTVYYNDFKKVHRIKANIYDAYGQLVRSIEKNEVKDYAAVDGFSIYSDSRLKYLDIDYNEYPYTIEFEYEYTSKKFKYYPSWYIKSYGVSVQESSFQITLPETNGVQYKAYNLEIDPTQTKENGKKTLVWKIENSKAIKHESYMPIYDAVLPHVIISPTNFKLGKYEGEMTSWDSYGKFMYKLNKDRDVLSEEMRLKIKALTKDASSDKEKVDILYKYLKDNMRYVSVQLGVGGWQTFDAAYVEKNKYGDCKALTNFTMAMLKEAGIKAHTALINSGAKVGNPDPEFTRPKFNHVILNIPSEDLWLECTSNTMPAGYLGVDNYGKNVLLVTEEGGKFSSTPTWPYEKNLTQTETKIEIQNNGTAKIHNITKHQGDRHEVLRYVESKLSKQEFEERFLEQFNLSVQEVLKMEVRTNPDAPKGELEYELITNKYGSKAGKRFFVPLNAIHKFSRKLKKLDQRVNPVFIKDGYIEENVIDIKLPKHIDLESFPKEKINFSSEYGSYSLELIPTDEGLKYKRRIEIKPINIPAEQYKDLRAFYKKISKSDNSKIVAIDNRT